MVAGLLARDRVPLPEIPRGATRTLLKATRLQLHLWELQLYLGYLTISGLARRCLRACLLELAPAIFLYSSPPALGSSFTLRVIWLSQVVTRQGSFNDLQSLLLLNLTIVTVGGLIKHFVVDPAANTGNLTLDQDWYRVSGLLLLLLQCMLHPMVQGQAACCFMLQCMLTIWCRVW